jgi:hypothetical protein
MRYIRWGFWTLFWLLFATFAHYTLPQNDIVRVTGSEVIRKDFSGFSRLFYAQPDAGDSEAINRDLRLINTTQANGRVMVYRNEDTGWGWPPYFKFDSSNLQAEASEFSSTRDQQLWVAVRHYGWRNPFLSIYPNAIAFRVVDGPNASVGLPWFNIIFITCFVGLVLGIQYQWRRFRSARIDPIVENVQDGFDAAGDAVSDHRSRVKRWLDTWRAPKR